MKLLLVALITLLTGSLLWYGVREGSGVRACTLQYQNDLATINFQTNSVRSDPGRYCQVSFDTLSAWEDCVQKAHRAMHQPIVWSILAAVGEPSTKLSVFENEHDDKCVSQSDLMFRPPVRDQ